MAKRKRGSGRPLTDEARILRHMTALMRAGGFSSLTELAKAAAVDDGSELVIEEVDLSNLFPDEIMALIPEPAPSAGAKPIALPPEPGTKSVTIRVKAWVLRDFKIQGEKTGIPYQRLMNRALADAAGRFV